MKIFFITSWLRVMFLPVLVLLLASTGIMVGVVAADERDGIQRSSSLLRRSNSHLFVLKGNTTCDLYLKDIEYETTTRRPNKEEEWVCELSQEDSLRIGGNRGNYGSSIRYVDIIVESDCDSDSDSSSSASASPSFISAISGLSSMIISGTEDITIIIDIEEDKMYIPHDTAMEIRTRSPPNNKNNNTRQRQRQRQISSRRGRGRRGLATKEGVVLRTVVIRVTDSEGISPQASREKLINDFYSNTNNETTATATTATISLKSQYESCSYGKLQIEPFVGKTKSKGKMIKDGVVDIKVDYNIFDTTSGGNRNKLQRAAIDTAVEEIGDLKSDDDFDLILFCFPAGTGKLICCILKQEMIYIVYYSNGDDKYLKRKGSTVTKK
jgi:hypothetical protein